MGYYVYSGEQSIKFKEGVTTREILDRVKRTMFTDEALEKRAQGGSYGTGVEKLPVAKRKWYSWTDTEKCRQAIEGDDLVALLNEFLADPQLQFDGNCPTHLEFSFDSSAGQEDELFAEIAPFIEAGSYCNWIGEDGEMWQWKFTGTEMRHVAGVVSYPDADGPPKLLGS